MLYTFIHKVALLALKLFFNEVTIQNREKVPQNSPVIFVANHPNFFMDPLIVGSCCPRILHFFAKSTIFSSRFKNLFLDKLNLIPSGNFALYYSKSLMKYRQQVKFLSFFYKKRKIIFDTIKQRIDLLQFIEESKNKYQQAVLR